MMTSEHTPAANVTASPSDAPRHRKRRPSSPTILNVTNDPVRALIAVHARQKGVTQKELAELCGRKDGWMAVYLHKGIPRALDRDQCAIIARALDLDPLMLSNPNRLPPAAVTASLSEHDPEPAPDIPLFQENRIIGARTEEWVPRPSDNPGAGGRFALQVQIGGGRTRPGDVLYCADLTPRVGDLTVCLRNKRVAAIGELAHMDNRVIRLNTGTAMCDLRRTQHQVCKVTSLVTA